MTGSNWTRAAAALGLLALGACASIPERAWVNGAQLNESRAYRQFMSGDANFGTLRQMRTDANALVRFQRTGPAHPAGIHKTASF